MPRPAVVVYTAWAACTLIAVSFVAHLGTNFPYMDEWPTVDALDGRVPLGPWLAEWHNEHLLPIPRLAYWGLYRATGDLRTAMFVNVGVWSGLAFVLAHEASRVRGRAAYADAFFPLILLHPGHAENFLMSYQVGFAISTGLAAVGLVAGLRDRPMIVAAVAAALPFCGAHGAAFAGPFAAAAVWSSRTSWRKLLACGPSAAVALWGVSLYATHRPPTPDWVPPATFAKTAAGIFGYAAMGYGPAGAWLWRTSAAVPIAVGILLIVARKSRSPAWAYLACGLFLAAVIGYARGRYGTFAVFFPRYSVLSAAVPIGAHFVFLADVRTRKIGPAFLAMVVGVAYPANAYLGWRDGSATTAAVRGADADLRAGMSTNVIAEKYHFKVFNNVAYFASALDRYKAADPGRAGN